MANDASKYPPPVVSMREGPELGRTNRPQIIGKAKNSNYPLIDYDPHFSRVVRYARPSDWFAGGVMASAFPIAFRLIEYSSPSYTSAKSFAAVMRTTIAMGLGGGFLLAYSRSINRFYGITENRREIDKDMREMVDRVKKGEPLYGKSTLTDYMQGVAARQSRYAGVWIHVIPWFNFVNHPHHGVDTAKYYRQAELELEAERK